MQKSESSHFKILSQVISLAFISFICLFSIVFIYQFNQKRIKDNQISYEKNTLIGYFLPDKVKLSNPKQINLKKNKDIGYLFCTEMPYLVIKTSTYRGYNGHIPLFITLNLSQQKIMGIMPGEHKETPGLGDQIDPQKSDWYQQFKHINLNTLLAQQISLKKQSGNIDAITGATITTKAVTQAVSDSIISWKKHNRNLPLSYCK